MVIRAKFENLEEQREFFINAKRKLGIGTLKLSRCLGLPSRGILESCIGMRTSPPLWIVKKVAKLSDVIPPKFETVKGIVRRKKRSLFPMPLDKSIEILNRKFGDEKLIIKSIRDGKTITEIEKKLRDKGFKFDNSAIGRSIGTLKKASIIKIVDSIDTKDCVIVKGRVNKSKGDFLIGFNLKPLSEKCMKEKIKVGIIIQKNFKQIKIFPLNFGRKLSTNKRIKRLRILLPLQLGLKIKSRINIVIPVEKFGLTQIACIQDRDGKILAKKVREINLKTSPIRSTNNDERGDLVLKVNDTEVIIEITRAKSRQIGRFKIGQCLIQSLVNPNSVHFIIARKNLFSKIELKALEKIGTVPVFTEFEREWETTALKEIIDILKRRKNKNFKSC